MDGKENCRTGCNHRDTPTNKEVIAIDRDPLGRAGRRVKRADGAEAWASQLADGGGAVASPNRTAAEANTTVSWTEKPGSASTSVLTTASDAADRTITGEASQFVAARSRLMGGSRAELELIDL
jgi:hypothetical protein